MIPAEFDPRMKADIVGNTTNQPTLPAYARCSINRCNLPAVILGSLTFQQAPTDLFIDGVMELHRRFFQALDSIAEPSLRAVHFRDYMSSSFLLDHKDEAGFDAHSQRIRRDKADYLRLLRGWMFDADNIEGAVLKRWVESRFGLLPRNHNGPIGDCHSLGYQAYQADYMRGIYNANALESQLDLLYSFCQYELRRREPEQSHRLLFRGFNQIDEHDILGRIERGELILLLNNLNSFSSDRFQSCTFGDHVLSARVPRAKLLYFHDLLPGVLKGEHEYIVIGGVYRVSLID